MLFLLSNKVCSAPIKMTYFLRLEDATKMLVVFVFTLAFLGNYAAGNLDLLGDQVSGREELVSWAGYGEDKLSTVVISGRILCHVDKTSLNPLPVSGARVSVVCGTNRKAKKRSSAKGSTDVSGSFSLDLPSHLHAIPNLERVCHVRVVNLPGNSPCRQACAAKHNKPIALSSVGHGIRTYTTNTIKLTPPL